MYFKEIITTITAITQALIFGLYLHKGPTILFDSHTLLIIIFQLNFLMYCIYKEYDKSIICILSIYLYIIILFVIPRLIDYLYNPNELIFAYGSGGSVNNVLINNSMVNKALILQLAGIISFYLGSITALFLLKKYSSTNKFFQTQEIISPTAIIITIALLFTIRIDSLHNWLYREIFYITRINYENFHALIEILFNYDMAFVIGFCILFEKTLGFNKSTVAIYFLTAIYMIIKTYSGSRAGGTYILISTLISLSFHGSEHKISIKNIILFIITISIVSVCAFKIATNIREQSNTSRSNIQSITIIKPNTTQSLVASNPPSTTQQINNRLGAYLDSLIVTTNLTPKKDILDKYITIEYSLKSAINIIVPGVIFNCCVVNTSFLPGFIYGHKDINLVYSNGFYESSYWTIFGLSYAMSGLIGMILVLFGGGMLLTTVFHILDKSPTRKVTIPIFLVLFVYMFFIMQGIDAYIVDIQKFYLNSFIGFLFMRMLSKIKFRANY